MAEQTGIWAFHCHIAWHSSGGFFSQLLVQPDKVAAFDIPDALAQTCNDWAAWTGTNIPDHIDSGL